MPEPTPDLLITTEVVTNAVVHAGPHQPGEAMVMGLTCGDGVIRVEVRDNASRLPEVRPVSDGPGGRGLFLLDSLAASWGVKPTNSGKVVWFEVSQEP